MIMFLICCMRPLLGSHKQRPSPACLSSVVNKVIECKHVETKSAFLIEGQGAMGVAGFSSGAIGAYERLKIYDH